MRKRSKLKIYEYQEAYKKYYDEGWQQSEIARYLGRTRSTISRLFARDKNYQIGTWNVMTSYAKAMYAWEQSKKRASKSRQRLRLKEERIRKIVVFILCRWHWSPENISDFLKAHDIQISSKAIYNFIKKEKPLLIKYLRQRGKPRRQRVSRPRSLFRVGVPEKISIHVRPELISSGHWEIDSVVSKRGSKGGVLSLRELSSRRRFFFILPDLKSRSVMRVLFPFFQGLPAHMRKTLTSDNGSEFAELYKLEKVLDNFGVYYCDPYKAWQRGSVENANGELRWFFAKKTDFSLVSQKELKTVEYKINWKPMRVNNGRSATAVYKEMLEQRKL